jgi:hypothetical protein
MLFKFLSKERFSALVYDSLGIESGQARVAEERDEPPKKL